MPEYDAEYERLRNELIPEAERHANKMEGTPPIGGWDEWCPRWNKAFHDRMNQLARERGLC